MPGARVRALSARRRQTGGDRPAASYSEYGSVSRGEDDSCGACVMSLFRRRERDDACGARAVALYRPRERMGKRSGRVGGSPLVSAERSGNDEGPFHCLARNSLESQKEEMFFRGKWSQWYAIKKLEMYA